MKKYGYSSILEPVLEDLKKLETLGIEILIVDNLAAHAVGVFFKILVESNVFVDFAWQREYR